MIIKDASVEWTVTDRNETGLVYQNVFVFVKQCIPGLSPFSVTTVVKMRSRIIVGLGSKGRKSPIRKLLSNTSIL